MEHVRQTSGVALESSLRRQGARSAVLRRLAVIALLCLTCVAMPGAASALEVHKLTCQPNGDSGSDVLGGVETRITWEVQAAPDE